jgi:hypothetical protein
MPLFLRSSGGDSGRPNGPRMQQPRLQAWVAGHPSPRAEGPRFVAPIQGVALAYGLPDEIARNRPRKRPLRPRPRAVTSSQNVLHCYVSPDWKNKLFFGDNLQILRKHVADETVDLVYLDPPFNSKADYNVLFKTTAGEASAPPQQTQAPVSVKAGANIKRGMVATLKGDMARSPACLVTLEEPTAPMRQEAADAGRWTSDQFPDRSFPVIQLLTVEQILRGDAPDLPRWVVDTFKKAAKAKTEGPKQETMEL